MTGVTAIACLMTALQLLLSLLLMELSSDLLPDSVVFAWSDLQRTLSRFLDLNPIHQPQSAMARAHLLDTFGAILSDDSVESWLVSCNVLSLTVMAVFHSFVQPVTHMSRLAGASVVIGPSIAVWAFFPRPLRVIASLCVFFGMQIVGWRICSQSAVPGRRLSDVTKCWQSDRKTKPYDPRKYFNLRKGIFVGLTPRNKPVYITIKDARQHLQLMGQTRFGKTVFAILSIGQFLMLDECCIIIDPKRDKFMPGVLWNFAKEQGRPFYLIDLQCQLPQLNPLAGCTVREKEELFIQCLDLIERGDMSDIYFLLDRQAACVVARLDAESLPELLQKASQIPEVVEAKRFFSALTELCSLAAVQTAAGTNLTQLVGEAGIIYVVGSADHEPTIRLQKLIFHRMTQIIREKGLRENARWTTIFLDEFKYVLSPGVLQAIGVIADRNCHLLIAHQALGDLKDCRNLSPASVESIIKTNSGFKCVFRTSDPDSAIWASRVSGTVPVYSELAPKQASPLGDPQGTWRESATPLFDANEFLTLPPFHGIIMGVGVPQKIRVHFLPEGERPTPKDAPAVHIQPQELI
jgi:type IV secretory pathway TraG/TraD family ATPase VirD4